MYLFHIHKRTQSPWTEFYSAVDVLNHFEIFTPRQQSNYPKHKAWTCNRILCGNIFSTKSVENIILTVNSFKSHQNLSGGFKGVKLKKWQEARYSTNRDSLWLVSSAPIMTASEPMPFISGGGNEVRCEL